MTTVVEKLENKGFHVDVIHPGLFHTFPLPNYKEISVAWNFWDFKKKIKKLEPDYFHISVEGPLGLTARNYCIKNKIKTEQDMNDKSNCNQFLNIAAVTLVTPA